MTDFGEEMRREFPGVSDALSPRIGLKQIELQEETNRLLAAILQRMPAFTITPIPPTEPMPPAPEPKASSLAVKGSASISED